MDYHLPVLYEEVLENLVEDRDMIYLDCTLGGAGHSKGILERSTKNSKLIAIDQDQNAIDYASKKLEKYIDKVKIYKNNFENLDFVIYMAGYEKVDRILMDIGVSSKQLDEDSRGFSYKKDSKLDMRMDENQSLSAYNVINEYSEKELADIIYKYGEEPKSRKIAKYIVESRKIKKIETTLELANIVIKAIGKSMKKHPAKRTFQAIRIYVNRELEVLEKSIDKAINLLNNGGKLAIITFHSLEDRIVKEKFRKFQNPCECDERLPMCMCGKKSLGKILTKKPIVSKEKELLVNNRAHSAKLRIFIKGED